MVKIEKKIKLKFDFFCFLGKIHELQLISMGQNFSLTVDRGYTRYINNRGQRAFLNTSEIRALYIGGLPNDLTSRALQLWHIREATSFQGKTKNLWRFIQ
jgi:hypothetical protein